MTSNQDIKGVTLKDQEQVDWGFSFLGLGLNWTSRPCFQKISPRPSWEVMQSGRTHSFKSFFSNSRCHGGLGRGKSAEWLRTWGRFIPQSGSTGTGVDP